MKMTKNYKFDTIMLFLWNGLIIGGCSFIVFGLGHSGWWFLLSLILLAKRSDEDE
jgi:hypothetical protein